MKHKVFVLETKAARITQEPQSSLLTKFSLEESEYILTDSMLGFSLVVNRFCLSSKSKKKYPLITLKYSWDYIIHLNIHTENEHYSVQKLALKGYL